MVEAYKIGISIAYKYQGAAEFAAMARDLMKINKLAKAAEQALGGLGKSQANAAESMSKTFAQDIERNIGRVTRAMKQAQGGAANGWSEAFSRSQSASERAARAWGNATGRAAADAFAKQFDQAANVNRPQFTVIDGGKAAAGPKIMPLPQVLPPQPPIIAPLPATRSLASIGPREMVTIGGSATPGALAARAAAGIIPPGGGGGGSVALAGAGGGRGIGPSLNASRSGAAAAGGGAGGGGFGGGGYGGMFGGFALSDAGYGIEHAGKETLGAIHDFYEAGKEYEQTFATFKALNLGDVVNADADKFARGVHGIGVSSTDMMRTLAALHTAMGNYDEAKAIAPLIADMEFANAAVFTGRNKFDPAQAAALGKVIEMRGGFRSAEEMRTQADLAQHVISGTSGNVLPSDYLAFLKTAGVAGRLQDDKTFYYQMEPLIQEMGGQRAGTGLMSAYQNLGQGRTTQRTMNELKRLGLLSGGTADFGGNTAEQNEALFGKNPFNEKNVEFSSTGKLLAIHPGAVAGGDLVGSDPLKFLQNILLPAFKAHGITDDKAIVNELGTLFTNRTAAAMYSLLFQQIDKVRKNMGINEGAMGLDDLHKTALGTPQGAEEAAKAAWKDLYTELGIDIIPIVIPALKGLAEAIRSVTEVVKDNPTMATTVVAIGAGLGVMAVGIGSLATAVGSFMVLKAGLPLLAAGISTLASSAAPFAGGAAAAAGLGAVVTAISTIAGLLALGAQAKGTTAGVDDFVSPKYRKDGAGDSFINGLLDPVKNDIRGWFGLAPIDRNGATSNTSPMAGARMARGSRFDASGDDSSATSGSSSDPGSSSDGKMDELIGAVRTLGDQLNGATVQLDGRTAGQLILDNAARTLNGPRTGMAGFDSTLSYSPVR
jgi:hypothetical protein